jgi:hypothetical protein
LEVRVLSLGPEVLSRYASGYCMDWRPCSPLFPRPRIVSGQHKIEIFKQYRDLICVETRAGDETKAVEI